MTIKFHRNAFRMSAATAILALFAGLGSAAAGDKTAPAARPAPAPARSSGGGAARGGGSYNRPSAPSGSGFQRQNTGGPGQRTPATTGGSIYTPNSSNYGNRPAQNFAPSTNNRQPVNNARPSGFRNDFVPRGSNEHINSNGSAFRTRSDGRVSDVHDARRGLDVHNGLNGDRRVSVERPGGGRMVSERGRPGYAQRGYSYHGHDFGRRAYYYHGHEFNRYYRGYGYRGLYLDVYAPGFYYGPGFYGWAYNPWAAPIVFGWGWEGSPWYGYYGWYFAPYPVYPSASYWLTDYLISQDLQESYAAQQAAGDVDGAPPAFADGAPQLTPEIKQEIADEVRQELALENSEATQTAQQQDVDPGSSGIARLLSDGRQHVFVAGDALDLVDSNGQECAISEGDVLLLKAPPPADSTTADLVVLASKGGRECAKYSLVSVQLTDLQEMQNQMRATIDQGLQELQAKQGKDGLPPAPPSALAKPAQPDYATIAPPSSPQDLADLQQQGQQANLAEKEVAAGAQLDNNAPPSAVAVPAAPPSVQLGQSFNQVEGAFGAPQRVARLGAKVIYYYNGMKVIFQDGRVSDVQ
jgi:hypothetical protein